MTSLLTNKDVRATALAALLGLALSLPARAATYNHVFDYSGEPGGAVPVPQGDTAFSVEHPVSMSGFLITSFQIVLTFNSSQSLTGDALGIQGLLTLGTSPSSPYINFFPVASYNGSGSQRIYEATFTGTSGSPGTGFSGLNPNNTWSLTLFDNGTDGIENGLVGWSLDITAVPEPVNVALGLFGVVFAGVAVGRRLRIRARAQV